MRTVSAVLMARRVKLAILTLAFAPLCCPCVDLYDGCKLTTKGVLVASMNYWRGTGNKNESSNLWTRDARASAKDHF